MFLSLFLIKCRPGFVLLIKDILWFYLQISLENMTNRSFEFSWMNFLKAPRCGLRYNGFRIIRKLTNYEQIMNFKTYD